HRRGLLVGSRLPRRGADDLPRPRATVATRRAACRPTMSEQTAAPGWVPWAKRLDDLAAAHPDRPAIVFVPRSGSHRPLTRDVLAQESNRAARVLEERGAGIGSLVVLALPNSIEHFVLSIAVWKLGGCVLPLNP